MDEFLGYKTLDLLADISWTLARDILGYGLLRYKGFIAILETVTPYVTYKIKLIRRHSGE